MRHCHIWKYSLIFQSVLMQSSLMIKNITHFFTFQLNHWQIVSSAQQDMYNYCIWKVDNLYSRTYTKPLTIADINYTKIFKGFW